MEETKLLLGPDSDAPEDEKAGAQQLTQKQTFAFNVSILINRWKETHSEYVEDALIDSNNVTEK